MEPSATRTERLATAVADALPEPVRRVRDALALEPAQLIRLEHRTIEGAENQRWDRPSRELAQQCVEKDERKQQGHEQARADCGKQRG